jgi:hypothetical protein
VPTFIAFWNCTLVDGWQRKRFDERLTALASAVFTAEIEMRMRMTNINSTWIFVAPEYAFAGVDRDAPKPAEHVSTETERELLNEMARLTRDYRNLLLAPGSIPVRDENQGRNSAHAYFGGRPVWRVDKCVGVGEVTPQEAAARTLIFRPGLGYASAEVDNIRYGAEICRDSTGSGTLPGPVQRHIVVGQGVGVGIGKDYICNKATELLIVADPGAFGVYNCSTPAKTQVRSCGNETALGCKLHYFVA